MNVLHYTLGLPPYRSGGLTKYSTDLMKAQEENGCTVSLLWPGRMNLLRKRTKISEVKVVNHINTYEIINPLPIPLLNGIRKIDKFIEECQIDVYYKFIKKINPDIIHVHTLMGIHKEFFIAAKELNIKVIYTTHDYFGLCPKVNFLCNNSICVDSVNCSMCNECNNSAFSYWKILLMQSSFYRILKQTNIFKYIKKLYKNNKKNEGTKKKLEFQEVNNRANEYKLLRSYYLDILNIVDEFHFNSSISKQVFEEFLNVKNYRILSILHRDISDKRYIKQFNETLRISYLGPTKIYKGYNLLIDVLDDLYKEGCLNIELNIYSDVSEVKEYINVKEKYDYSDLGKVFNESDLVIVPSLWKETFGLVVVEALSYAVPTIISSNVGAKDIITNMHNGIVIEPSYKDLAFAIKQCYEDREILRKINKNICNDKSLNFDFLNHLEQINKLYIDNKE